MLAGTGGASDYLSTIRSRPVRSGLLDTTGYCDYTVADGEALLSPSVTKRVVAGPFGPFFEDFRANGLKASFTPTTSDFQTEPTTPRPCSPTTLWAGRSATGCSRE